MSVGGWWAVVMFVMRPVGRGSRSGHVFGIVGFRDLDGMLVDGHHEIQEVHGVEVELVSKADSGVERGEIRFGGNVAQSRSTCARVSASSGVVVIGIEAPVSGDQGQPEIISPVAVADAMIRGQDVVTTGRGTTCRRSPKAVRPPCRIPPRPLAEDK